MSSNSNTIAHLSRQYLEHMRVRHFTHQTVYGREKTLRYFRQFCEHKGLAQVHEVTRPVMLSYQTFLFSYRKLNGLPLAVDTQKQRLTAVRAFFSWLTREDLAFYNPASDLDLPRGEVRLPRFVLTGEEVDAILRIPKLDTPVGLRDRAILEVFYSTGIRRQELCFLDRSDVDASRGLLRIEQGKGHKDRYVPIGDRALRWIDRYWRQARQGFLPALGENALFLNTLGSRLTPNRLGTLIHQIIEQAKIGKRGSCHLFRHTFATLLLENGCDIRYVQEMLGHAKLETTSRYTHVALNKLKEIHERYHPASSARES